MVQKMKKIKYEIIKMNSRLTDFDIVKDLVLANKVKNVPSGLKNISKGYDKNLYLYA
jgi:hypothetical protein